MRKLAGLNAAQLECQRSDHVAADGFAPADSVHALVGFSLQVDFLCGYAERFSQRFTHFRKMRSEFWPLQNYHRIDIFDREVFRLQQSAGVLEENQAVRTLPLRVAIRKVRANIAKSCRAKKRVTQCVGEHVSIGMADRTLVERHFDPAD